MKPYAVDNFEFDLWEGEPPPKIGDNLTHWTKPGADGTGAKRMGKWASPFEFTAVKYLKPSQMLLASDLERQVKAMIGNGPVPVTWENIPQTNSQVEFEVLDARTFWIKRLPRIMGPGFDHEGGIEVKIKIRLQPY